VQSTTTEWGIPGVEVRLLNSAGVEIASMITDSLGRYRFGGLAPSTYNVEFVLPSGFEFSPGDRGIDDKMDSDTTNVVVQQVERETVARAPVTILAGADDLTIDAGLVAVAAAATLDETGDPPANQPGTTGATLPQQTSTSAPPTTTGTLPATTSAPATDPPPTPAAGDLGGTG
jgi:hypothetical protein